MVVWLYFSDNANVFFHIISKNGFFVKILPMTNIYIELSQKLISICKHAIVETTLCLCIFFLMPHGGDKTRFLGFSLERLGILGILVLLISGFTLLLVCLSSNIVALKKVQNHILNWANHWTQFGWISVFSLTVLIISFFLILSVAFSDLHNYGLLLIRLFPLSILLFTISLEIFHKFLTFFCFSKKTILLIFFIVLSLSWWFGYLNENYSQLLIILTPIVLLSITILGGTLGWWLFIAKINLSLKNSHLNMILAVFGLIYIQSAVNFAPINREINRFDQQAYANFIHKARESNFTYTGDRNRMPVYPFLQALFNDSDKDEDIIFQRGKMINIYLSFLLLVSLYFIIQRTIPNIQAFIFLLIIAFSLFIYKSAYVQAELLYYFLSFVSFLLIQQILKKPTIILGFLTGIMLGFSFLTKASILPMVGLFIFFFVVKICHQMIISYNKKSLNIKVWKSISFWTISLIVTLGAFFSIIFPYILESKNTYTKFFYNVNTTFYFWNDSWDEIGRETKAHGDRVGWPDMPPEKTPSFERYFREHTINNVTQRLASGIERVFKILSNPYGEINYLFFWCIFFMLTAIKNRDAILVLFKKYYLIVFFVISYFIITFLLVSWYIIIPTRGDRFVYALYLPILFTAIKATSKLIEISPKQAKIFTIKQETSFEIIYNLFFFLISFDSLIIMPVKYTQNIFGW